MKTSAWGGKDGHAAQPGEVLGTQGRPHAPSQVMTDVAGNPEEERRAEFYHQPWSQEAVSRYFYCKVMEAPEHQATSPSVLGNSCSSPVKSSLPPMVNTCPPPYMPMQSCPGSQTLPGKGCQDGLPLVTHQDHCNLAPAHTSSKDPAAQAGAGAISGCAKHLGARGRASLWTSQTCCPASALGSGLPALLLWRGVGRAGLKVTHQTAALWSVTGDWEGRRGRRGARQ